MDVAQDAERAARGKWALEAIERSVTLHCTAWCSEEQLTVMRWHLSYFFSCCYCTVDIPGLLPPSATPWHCYAILYLFFLIVTIYRERNDRISAHFLVSLASTNWFNETISAYSEVCVYESSSCPLWLHYLAVLLLVAKSDFCFVRLLYYTILYFTLPYSTLT